jgi:hypothetical protein
VVVVRSIEPADQVRRSGGSGGLVADGGRAVGSGVVVGSG